jgi:hypothetical protein
VEKTKFLTTQGLELRPFCRPARSQLLYRLRYPGSYWILVAQLIYAAFVQLLLRVRRDVLISKLEEDFFYINLNVNFKTKKS